MAACVGTRDDEELKELFDNAESFDLSFFSNNTVAEFVKHFISTGTLHDARVLQMRLKRLLGNATFLQAFQHSGGPSALHIFYLVYALSSVRLCLYVPVLSDLFTGFSWGFILGQGGQGVLT